MATSGGRHGWGYILDPYHNLVNRHQYRPVDQSIEESFEESIEMDPPLGFKTDVSKGDPQLYSNGTPSQEDTKVVSEIPFSEAAVVGRKREATFASEGLQDFSKPIDSYEGRHRWDPKFEWDEKEEKRLTRKVSGNRGLCESSIAIDLPRLISKSVPGSVLPSLPFNLTGATSPKP